MEKKHGNNHTLSETGHQENEKKKGDHYHNEHHIFGENQEDDVAPTDFSPRNFFKKNQTKNAIFYISATAIFLALAVVSSIIDIGLELLGLLIPPINGIPISIRFLDVLMAMLAVTSIGPHFASIVAFITPFLHAVIHGEIWNPYEPLFDGLSYVLVVWLLWVFFYVIFRNSLFHRHPNAKIDRFRRWTPLIPFTLLAPVIFTGFYVLTIYLTTLQGKTNNNISFHDFVHLIFVNLIIIYIVNVVRCGIDVAIFIAIEPKLKIINHRYY